MTTTEVIVVRYSLLYACGLECLEPHSGIECCLAALRSRVGGCYVPLPSWNLPCSLCRLCRGSARNHNERAVIPQHLGLQPQGATAYSPANPLNFCIVTGGCHGPCYHQKQDGWSYRHPSQRCHLVRRGVRFTVPSREGLVEENSPNRARPL
jgi:hypothetical protein